MVDNDHRLAAVLNAVLPETASTGDWDRVVRDANRTGLARRLLRPVTLQRRLALAGTLAVLVALIPLSALAVTNNWWFFSTPLSVPSPIGDLVTIDQGQWGGVPWALTAYNTTSHGLCISVTPNPPSGHPTTPSETPAASGTMLGCGLVRGLSEAPNDTSAPELTLVSAAYTGTDGTQVNVLAGATAPDVAEVATVGGGGGQVTAETTPAPSELGLPVRFFIMRLTGGTRPVDVQALDTSGHLLQDVSLP